SRRRPACRSDRTGEQPVTGLPSIYVARPDLLDVALAAELDRRVWPWGWKEKPMSDRRPVKHGVTVTLPTDPTDREEILNLWREQGIHVSGGQEGDGIANTDPEALLKPRRYRMNSLHDELVEALSIEDDDPTRMADRVLDVLQRETKSLGAAIA